MAVLFSESVRVRGKVNTFCFCDSIRNKKTSPPRWYNDTSGERGLKFRVTCMEIQAVLSLAFSSSSLTTRIDASIPLHPLMVKPSLPQSLLPG